MSHDGLRQLIYVSTYNYGRSGSALGSVRAILKTSLANNVRVGITGYLIFDGEGFLQILEGGRSSVETMFEAIEADPRHRDVHLVGRLEVAERAFCSWEMGRYLRRPEEAAIFARHGAVGPIMQAALSAEEAVSLALSLATSQAELAA